MGLNLDYIPGQTPIDEEELLDILIPSIKTQSDLNIYEQQNIEDAIQWTLLKTFKSNQLFSEEFLITLHKKMFGNVWGWAGTFRNSQKNIGVPFWEIRSELRKLLEDAKFWHEHQTYEPDEIALRFKHRLVSIHCFPNGNGRHSRLMADVIIENLYHREIFTWGTGDLSGCSTSRSDYLNAVKAADLGNYKPLLLFARS